MSVVDGPRLQPLACTSMCVHVCACVSVCVCPCVCVCVCVCVCPSATYPCAVSMPIPIVALLALLPLLSSASSASSPPALAPSSCDSPLTTMAVRVAAFGGPEVLKLQPAPDAAPAPGDGEITVRLYAAGVNPVDVRQWWRKREREREREVLCYRERERGRERETKTKEKCLFFHISLSLPLSLLPSPSLAADVHPRRAVRPAAAAAVHARERGRGDRRRAGARRGVHAQGQ